MNFGRRTQRHLAALSLLLAGASGIAEEHVTISHTLTLDDVPKYAATFKHLDYVNPNAPKGGEVRLLAIGSFDTFNPFNIKGDPPPAITYLFDPLMTSPEDDSLSEYGIIADTVEVPDDLSYVIYNLRPEATFRDGSPITADDVVFSFETLTQEGEPFYSYYYANVETAEALTSHRVKFSFSGPPNRELPQIVGQIRVLSKAYWGERDFTSTTLEVPVGTGPYTIGEFEPGRFIVYERVDDYWGKDIPLNAGRYNFDRIRYEFVRDQTVALEAFKAGQYDFRVESASKDWATAYDFPALRDGLVKKEMMPNASSRGMQALVFNIRRAKFRNRLVRQALGYAFDFEWSNATLFYGQYTRTASYFENSELAAKELPSEAELEYLRPFTDQLPGEVFTTVYEPPSTDGSGNARTNLREAAMLLRRAGWRVVDTKLIDPETEQPLEIEFLINSSTWERVLAPYIANLSRLGVGAQIRTVDSAQYQNRVRDFDYDMIMISMGQSRSPGNEQRDWWGSSAADRPGSRNFIGLKNSVVDALVEEIVAAKTRSALVAATRALDRVLLWGHYVVPAWHLNADRVVWWDKFGRPKTKPAYGIGFTSWWIDAEKVARIDAGQKAD